MRYILASQSPRRKSLLSLLGIPFEIIPSGKEEKTLRLDPSGFVEDLALHKAEDIYSSQLTAAGDSEVDRDDGHFIHPGADAGLATTGSSSRNGEDFLVIGADTIVCFEGKILGKPKDENDAFHMLSMLSGQTHQVYTGVALLGQQEGAEQSSDKIRIIFHEKTDVTFYPLTDEEIRAYIATGSPMDKAGAYGIQDPAFAIHVKGISGDYNNVVGLPVSRLYMEMKNAGLLLQN